MESNLLSTEATHSSEGTLKKRPLPSFVKKLWFILADEPSHEHIFWVDNGQVISVPNASSFSKVILPRFFKHSNWQSFVRQLNLYGFRKVYQLNLSYDESTEKRTVWQFKHECFKKDHPEKLCEIKRRASKANQQQQQQQQQASSFSSQQTTPTTFSFKNTNLQPSVNEFGLNGESIEQTLSRFAGRLEKADKKRRKLWDQTVRLSQIQASQQKAIRVLMEFIMQYLEKHPDSENDKVRFNSIMQKIMEQESNIEVILPYNDTVMSSGNEEVEEEDDILEDGEENDEESERNIDQYSYPPQQQQQQQQQQTVRPYSTYPQQQQEQEESCHMQQQQHQLPSISSLMTDHPDHILPPLRKRPNNRLD